MKMHADEPDIDEALVARLVATQCPRWSELPIRAVQAPGATNVMFRLGAHMVVRLPRVSWAVPAVEKEQTWLPTLAPALPLPVPAPLLLGRPGSGFPWLKR